MLINADRTYQLMESKAVDGLLATTLENVFYLTGIESLIQATKPLDSQVFALVTKESLLDPITIIPTIDVDTALEGFFNAHIYNYGTFFRYEAKGGALTNAETRLAHHTNSAHKEAYTALHAALEARNLEKRALGYDERGISPDFIQRLAQDFPSMTLIPAVALFREIRMIKTAEEISRLAMAAQITENAIMHSLSFVREGVTEAELARELEKSVIDQGGRLNYTCLHFGRNIPFLQAPANNTQLKRGDLIWYDPAFRYKGYVSDVSRVFAFGDPGPHAKELYQTIYKSWEAGLAKIGNSVKTDDIFQTCVSCARENGIPHFDRTHVGHGIGLENYDPPLLGPNSGYTLENGMVFTLEIPYYEIGFGGFNIEDTLVIADNKPQLLTSLSRELVIL